MASIVDMQWRIPSEAVTRAHGDSGRLAEYWHEESQMSWKRITTNAALTLVLVGTWMAAGDGPIGEAQSTQVPIFEYDATFPKPMPENWAIGPIGGLAVDRQDHLFVL